MIRENENRSDPLFASADCQNLIGIYETFYPEVGFEPPWVSYLIVRDGQAVGSCGFVGAPRNGQAEIAYWTFKEFEGQGVASFACRELLKIAFEAGQDVSLTAKTAPEENASTKVLRKNGFVFSEIVQDHEIGDAWLWTYKEDDNA